MKLYSSPYLLFDPSGVLVWNQRAGQRARGNTGTADLEEAITRVASGKYSLKTTPTSMRPTKSADIPLFNFEDGPAGWNLSGDAWKGGTDADFPGLVKGFDGRRFLSSFPPSGAPPTGIAVSPTFKIEKRYMHLKVGGGDLPQHTGIALLCEGSTPQLSCGKNTFELDTVTWDLGALLGKTARLVAYDCGKTEQRDGIMLDAVVESDSPTPPASFADHHNPNNQTHAARVAGAVPEDYKAFQNGDFHCSAKPGPTFEVQFSGAITPFYEPSTCVRELMLALPDTVAQTIGDQSAELEVEGKTIKGMLVKGDGKTISSDQVAVEYSGRMPKGKPMKYTYRAQVTPNSLTFERGSDPNFAPLPEKIRQQLKATRSLKYTPEELAELQRLFREEGFERWKGETDGAYMLRAWRGMQRYWSGYSVWGGWPTSGKYKTAAVTIREAKSSDCPAAGNLTDLLDFGGIPSMGGQGQWAAKGGETLTPHVRGLAFIDKVGWVLYDDDKNVYSTSGQFTFGRSTGDNYFQHIWDHPTPATPLKANASPGAWASPGVWTSRIADKSTP